MKDNSENPPDSEYLVEYPGCAGTLSLEDPSGPHSTPITFALRVDRTGLILLEVEDQPLTADNFWIKRAFSSDSPTVAAISLDGVNEEGHRICSDSIHLQSVSSPSTPKSVTLSLKASASHLTLLAPEAGHASPPTFQAEYWVAGLRWFRGGTLNMPAGEVAVRGDAKINDYSKLSGTIAVRSSADDLGLDDWLDMADLDVERVLQVTSFADGHFMRPSVRQAFRSQELARVDFFGRRRSSPPHKPPLHYLDFPNSLPSLIQAYDADLLARTGLDVALEWHLMPHYYDEARFVSQMTAIEHMLHVFAQQSPDSTFIHKKTFKTHVSQPLTSTLTDVLKGLELSEDTKAEAIEGISKNLQQANRRNLRSNLLRMLREYDVPLDGLEEAIGPLITTRNDIVHRGMQKRDDDGPALSHRVTEAEELVRRLVFALLGYRGRYRTWLSRIEDKEFRPA